MRGIRLFFVVCLICAILIVALPIFSFISSSPPEQNQAVLHGQHIWEANNCAGCHTLYGQGGFFAPDLTHIYSQRGETYIREFLFNPNAFHPASARQMPRFSLTQSERDDLLLFLAAVDQNATSFPPQMINVSGGLNTVVDAVPAASQAVEEVPDDPAEAGRFWFVRPPAICGTCHSLEPDVVLVGPSLAGVASRAETRVDGQSAEEYLRNSILHPSEYVVEGFNDVMQKNFGDVLTADQINDLVAFLLTQTENDTEAGA
jgi:nitric oxide reductase subunit C